MTTFNDLLRLARNDLEASADKLLGAAEDTKTGVRVLVKRGPLGFRVECYTDGVRRNERTARALQDGE